MTLNELDNYFNSFLTPENFNNDPSQNGIQVQNKSPHKDSITKVAFAVDACLETIKQTIEMGAQVLVVHHGLFWGHEQKLTGTHYERIKTLIDNDIALYACHIPLDANTEVGNNYGLAQVLNLKNLQPFGLWNGMSLGVCGTFEKPLTCEKTLERLLPKGQSPNCVLPFGVKEIETVAIVSGGAGDLLEEAISSNVHLFITGEISHESYHTALENHINVIAAGHYNTETIGVTLLGEKLQQERNIEVAFINIPTGL